MGLLAGAERVEATLFGNGERTGNVDMITLALNMYTQGVDPRLDFSNINKIREMYERCTKMKVGERQPYAGELVFTAFSGSHQDAINKGTQYMKESNSDFWEIPYLPIDPADVGRQYEPIIRINSQSGKGSSAYVMEHNFGFDLPKLMHPEFGAVVQKETDRVGTEIAPERIYELFKEEYLNIDAPLPDAQARLYREHRRRGALPCHLLGHHPAHGHDLPGLRRGQWPHRRLLQRHQGREDVPLHLPGLQVPRHHRRLRLPGRGLHPAPGPAGRQEVLGRGRLP